MNLGAGVAVLSTARWRGLSQAESTARRRSVQVGIAAMAAFGQVYELVSAARR